MRHNIRLILFGIVGQSPYAGVAWQAGVARIKRDPDTIARETRAFLYEGQLGNF